MKKDKLYHTDFAAVGDSVLYDLNEDGTGESLNGIIIFPVKQ